MNDDDFLETIGIITAMRSKMFTSEIAQRNYNKKEGYTYVAKDEYLDLPKKMLGIDENTFLTIMAGVGNIQKNKQGGYFYNILCNGKIVECVKVNIK